MQVILCYMRPSKTESQIWAAQAGLYEESCSSLCVTGSCRPICKPCLLSKTGDDIYMSNAVSQQVNGRTRSSWAEQASVMVAAAEEAAKLDGWKAELLGEMKMLCSSVQAAVVTQNRSAAQHTTN